MRTKTAEIIMTQSELITDTYVKTFYI